MMHIRRLAAILSVLVATLLPIAAVTPVAAAGFDPFGGACSSKAGNTSKSAACSSSSSSTSGSVDPVSHVLARVTYILSIVLGVISVIFMIVGGFNYVTASGDPSSIASAKKTIIYAMVGLLVAALAVPIINLVVGQAT